MKTEDIFELNKPVTSLVLHAYQPHIISDDELKYIVDDSYLPLLLIHERIGIPFTLNIQGCLLDRLPRVAPHFVEKVNILNKRNMIELMTSAYYHPLLPLISKKSRMYHIEKNIEAHSKIFGARPKGFWPPELAWNPASVGELAKYGIKWVMVDGSALIRAWSLGSLRVAPSDGIVVPGELMQPYYLKCPNNVKEKVIAVVRHHLFSNTLFDTDTLISDSLMKCFINEFPDTNYGLICLAGDYERVYSENERRYEIILQYLLEKGVIFKTVSEGISMFQQMETIFIPPWSWQGSLDNWVRGEEERSYLRELQEAWQFYINIEVQREHHHSIEKAREALLKAECSCNLYWNGPFAFIEEGYHQIELAWQLMKSI